ncbi:MAG: HAMP domain-containing protein [Deltaproteobacteria bacterium]|nr:HAMP domain-containing protein [Deltaproteobacteria bacterium]
MRLSLSGRIALGLAAQTAVFAAAVTWLVWSADEVFESVSVIKDEVEPAVDDLRALLVELKAGEDLLVSGRPVDLERVRGQLPRARAFERLGSAAAALRRVSEREDVPSDAAADLAEAARTLDEVAIGDRLVAGATRTGAFQDAAALPASNNALFAVVLARLESAIAGAREPEVAALSKELLRLVRYVRATALRASNRASGALRDMNHKPRRSEVTISLVLVPAGALVAALLLLLLLLRALRPVRLLSETVRRLARGDYSTPVPTGFSREFADLANALNSLVSALRTREAEILRGRDELMRAERLAVVGRMASVVAHEVRNPLNSIALNADLLREMLAGRAGPRELEVLGAVQKEIDRLSDITEEYLRFGRLPKGVLAPCDAGRVIRETRDASSRASCPRPGSRRRWTRRTGRCRSWPTRRSSGRPCSTSSATPSRRCRAAAACRSTSP